MPLKTDSTSCSFSNQSDQSTARQSRLYQTSLAEVQDTLCQTFLEEAQDEICQTSSFSVEAQGKFAGSKDESDGSKDESDG